MNKSHSVVKEKYIVEIKMFIENLSSQRLFPNTVNLYRGNNRESQVRRNNLYHYLARMKTINPSVLFLGEAPGYNGARFSGIAFTSERTIIENNFFAGNDFQFINEPGSLRSELSANIVWRELTRHRFQPLIWNIFPFHPHKPNNQFSNRTPTSAELRIGLDFTLELLNLFNIRQIFSIGRKPESQLQHIGLPFQYIRHPAQGGGRRFAEEIVQHLQVFDTRPSTSLE